MFDYLQQFNKLPKELREKVSSPAVMEILSSLESKYGLSLAMLVMQVMIKQIPLKSLPSHFVADMGLSAEKAQALTQELQERIFFAVAAYLGLRPSAPLTPEEKELQTLMKENSIVLPSQDLMSRCRQILLTYRKGVRTKIDTRAALERSVAQGGLGLDQAASDRLLRALEQPLPSAKATVTATVTANASVTALNNLINNNEKGAYDLKKALASGQVKPPAALADKFKPAGVKLDPSHELIAPESELSLEAPDKILNLPTKTPAQAISTPSVKPSAPAAPTPTTIKSDISVVPPAPLVPPVPVAPVATEVSAVTADKPAAPAAATAKDLSSLQPPVAVNAPFKKATTGGLWSKLFKDKKEKASAHQSLGKITAASVNLEEAVRMANQKAATARPAASSETRPKMEDVKARPKVMGPLEELRYLDLINFRRLGSDPKDITTKIVSKIRLLEKDGYDRMVEGVQAWRQSPVNRIYVRLVQEAVAKGVTLKEAVAIRQQENKETLSMEEIEAIVAMNSQLMF